MSNQSKRIKDAYEGLRDSDEHDYQRVTYESPAAGSGASYEDGYISEAEIAGEAVLKVVKEDEVVSIPFSRVVGARTIEPNHD